jgi:alpha-acetolactate decarboxylase
MAVVGSVCGVLIGGCGGATAATRSAGTAAVSVQSFGTMHATMAGGAENAVSQVALDDVRSEPGTIALGTAVGLDGEITIYEGRTLVSRVRGTGFETVTDPSGEGAAWLTMARVPAWTDITVPSDMDQSAFEAFVARQAADAGLDTEEPFPIVVTGSSFDLRAHVLHGACPMRPGADLTAEQTPYVFEATEAVRVELVGFRASSSVGVLTHPGTTVHLHAIVDVEGTPLSAHVERFSVRAGATLRLPMVR